MSMVANIRTLSINITILECKFKGLAFYNYIICRINITILECKSRRIFDMRININVLI